MKRTLALLLAALMLLTLMVGCASEPATNPSTTPSDTPATETPAETPDEPAEEPAETPSEEPADEPAEETPVEEPAGPVEITYPLVSEPVTFEVLADGKISSGYPEMNSDLNNVLAVQKITELTGVNIKWNLPAETETTISLMLVAEDYTDGMVFDPNRMGASPDYYVEEDVILDLTDILETYCPNYWNLIHSDENIRRDAVTDGGNCVAMRKLFDRRPQTYMGYYVRTDVLEEAGFSENNLPVTYDDFYSILVAGKDDCTNAPLYLDLMTLMAGFDISTGYNHTGDNQLYFGPTSEAYKELLTMVANWNAEGLVDKDFATRITFFMDAGVFIGREVVAYPATFSFRNVFEGAGLEITSIPLPKREAGDQRYIAVSEGARVAGNGLIIFAPTENPELLAQWFDYCYSEEGTILTNLGVQGVSYDFDEAGNYIYPLDPETPTVLQTFNSMMPFQSLTWVEYIGESEARANDRAKWDADWSYDSHSAKGELTVEESEDVSAIQNDINTYVSEFRLGVISGTRSIDEWDEYVAYVESLGLAECLEAYQAAHDRYQSR